MLQSGVLSFAEAGHPLRTETAGGWTPSTPFQIASVSKNIAATLVVMLADEDRLDLHEPLARWLPEATPAWHLRTLHQLLSHTAGVGHWPDVPGLSPAIPATRDERLTVLLGEPPKAPGRFHYSGPGYLVVGAVAERAGGKSYAELLADRILGPLGMTATVSGTQPPGAAPGLRAGKPVRPWDTSSMVGAGDLWSTAEDLAAFALHRATLLTPQSLDLMRTEHARFDRPDTSADGRIAITGHGYGHFTGTIDGRPVTMHTGDQPGYASILAWLPDGRAMIGLANEGSTDWEDFL